MYAYISNDGLCQSNNIEMIQSWNNFWEEQKIKEQYYIEKLRANGISAWHPNDGWVNREDKYFKLVYPYFNDGVNIGSKVMLSFGDKDCERLVVVTNIKIDFFDSKMYYFDDIEE